MNQQIMERDPRDEYAAEPMAPASASPQQLTVIGGGDVERQLAAAQARPRDLQRVAGEIKFLATIDEETAEECLYALVRGSKNRSKDKSKAAAATKDDATKAIEGPSIRLAEIAALSYGNCRFGSQVIEVNRAEKVVVAEGIFWDLEKNVASRSTIRRSIRTSSGGLFSDDMINVTGNAAAAIAKRNAILAGIPRAIYRGAYNAARQMIAGDATQVKANWEKAVKGFASYGVKAEQLLEKLGLESDAEITPEHIAQLRGVFSSIKNGESTVEAAFAAPEPEKKPTDPNYNPLADAAGKKLTDEEIDKLFAEGQAARVAQADRTAPETYTEAQKAVWLNGFDTEPDAG